MKGPMKGQTERTPPTAKLEFCTLATWKNNEIAEERLFYNLAGFMKQLGLSK
jgi:hypothetical protein